ncbi:MAG: 50S ribosomal protein L11 methyltransferase [Bacteroidia bacterium]|nr:50S ribosomal protein L11 methyltransferase [Bacteroidia bacterium]
MVQYLKIEFQNISILTSEMLIAQLSEIGFDGFEENEHVLKAFIRENNFDEDKVNTIAGKLDAFYIKSIIEETNWNQLWESNFQPVIINDLLHKKPWVSIRAVFHKPMIEIEHEIIITPKMSFGTGHHATTSMMMQQMSGIDFEGKTVLDFGTGTGILSILAEKLGASKIIAVDYDEWSIENAKENFQQNNCKKIKLIYADTIIPVNKFDVILANINKNVILKNFPAMAEQVALNGILLISGLLAEDEKDILHEVSKFPLTFNKTTAENNWICLSFNHN